MLRQIQIADRSIPKERRGPLQLDARTGLAAAMGRGGSGPATGIIQVDTSTGNIQVETTPNTGTIQVET